jgi:two-component system sensor histidine kinase DesK
MMSQPVTPRTTVSGTAQQSRAVPTIPTETDFIRKHRRHMLPAFILSFIWIAFPAAGFVADEPSASRAVLVGLAIAAFMTLYITVMFYRRPFMAWAIVILLAIAVVLTILDRVDWSALFVFCAVVAGFRLPRPYCWYMIIVCSPLAAGSTLIAHGSAATAISMGVTAPAVGFMILAVARLLRANAELREAREQLAAVAVAEERLRFARDLHDLLGHSLSVIALKAELAGQLLASRSEEAGRNIEDIQSVARSALGEVREAVSGYREPRLEAEMAGARFALSAAGIKPTFIEASAGLPREIDSLLAWAVREGTTNVIRHSGARNCRIVVELKEGDAVAEITDDGPGTSAGEGGHGIEGLRERAERLLGRVEAGPRAQGGFSLRVTAPLPEVQP